MSREPMSDVSTAQPVAPPESRQPAPLPAPGGPKWFRRISSVLFIIFCFELGMFLLIYPWTDAWTDNYLSVAVPDNLQSAWRALWNSSFVRGGVSGLGLVNVWIAIAEVFRLLTRAP
jgi:hypothetical protein